MVSQVRTLWYHRSVRCGITGKDAVVSQVRTLWPGAGLGGPGGTCPPRPSKVSHVPPKPTGLHAPGNAPGFPRDTPV